MEVFEKVFNWLADLSTKMPAVQFKMWFIVVIAVIAGVGVIVALTLLGTQSAKLKKASKKISKYLADVEAITDENVEDFTSKCFSAKAPQPLRESWVQYLGVKYGYPSDIVNDQSVYDKMVKKNRDFRPGIFAGIALVLLAFFAFWGFGTLSNPEMGVIHCAGLLLIGIVYVLLVIFSRTQAKRCQEKFDEMLEDLDAKVNLQIESSYAVDASPLTELSAMVDEIVARNTSKAVDLEEDEDVVEETPIEALIAQEEAEEVEEVEEVEETEELEDEEIVEEEPVEEDVVEDEIVEEPVEEIVEEVVEDEVTEEVVEETEETVDEPAEDVVEEESTEETVEDVVEETPVEEVETTEEQVEETTEDVAEETVEETTEEVVEEETVEETVEETTEESEEAVEESEEELTEDEEVEEETEEVEEEAPAKFGKLPQLLDYMLDKPMPKVMKIKMAQILVASYGKTKPGSQDRKIVIGSLGKVITSIIQQTQAEKAQKEEEQALVQEQEDENTAVNATEEVVEEPVDETVEAPVEEPVADVSEVEEPAEEATEEVVETEETVEDEVVEDAAPTDDAVEEVAVDEE